MTSGPDTMRTLAKVGRLRASADRDPCQRARMSTDLDYMRLAIDEAVRAQEVGELPIGAVVVSRDGVVARNRCRETAEQTVLAHAELHAVNDACRALGRNNLSDCTIYCTNEPCLMCAAAIFQAKISRVVFGVARSDLPHIFRARNLRIGHLAQDSGYAPAIVEGLLKDDVMRLFLGLGRP
jgi:tRNA(Arg) A34 adenosine deaminase TadA